MEQFDTIIIGAGPAGLTAAIYLQRAGFHALVLEEYGYGGQMANTPEVENYPAVQKISGFELSTNLYNQVLEHGAQVEFDGVEKAELEGETKRVTTVSGKVYTAKAVIIANGARRRKLDIPGEETYSGRGVSYCATCDGGFFKQKTVVVVGGGNTAVEDALYLSNLCETVHILHRRDSFRAGKMLTDSLEKRENVQIHFDCVPLEILPLEGKNAVGAVRVKNMKTDGEVVLKTSAVFVAVGLVPDNHLFEGQLELDRAGYLVAGEDTITRIPGVFAAGDTRTKSLRQIVTAAGDGATAAAHAGAFLQAL